MIPLKWYRGIQSDIEAVSSGHGVVLYANEHTCRILTKLKTKILLTAYPSKEQCRIITLYNSIGTFEFSGYTYCEQPSYLYGSVSCNDKEKVLALYKRYCEVDNDPQMDQFMLSWKRTHQMQATPLTIMCHQKDSESDLQSSYVLAVTYEGKVLGQVGFSFSIKDLGHVSRVVNLDKKKLIEDVYILLKRYSSSPVREDVKVFVDNVLSDLARQLQMHGIEFDHSLFDD